MLFDEIEGKSLSASTVVLRPEPVVARLDDGAQRFISKSAASALCACGAANIDLVADQVRMRPSPLIIDSSTNFEATWFFGENKDLEAAELLAVDAFPARR